MTKHTIICIVLVFLLFGCSPADPAPQTESEPTELAVADNTEGLDASLQSYTEDYLIVTTPAVLLDHDAIHEKIALVAEKYGAIGIQVAIVNDGEVLETYAYGWATKNADLMTADHKMRVASISKVVVGITAMLLQEDGIIDIDTDIGEYWDVTARNPCYPDIPITIRSMLSHTSSIISYGDDYSTDYSSIRNRLLNGYCDTEPGNINGHYYNNYAFRVLGSTLEIAADQRMDDILQEKLFSIMDIDASFASGDISDTNMLVTLYRESGEVARSVETQKNIHLSDAPGGNGAYFAGGLTISASDLGKIVALLASDGVYEEQQLLEDTSVELMETYIAQPLSDGSYQALPLFYVPGLYGRSGIYFHPGSAYGVYNCISYDSSTGDGVVVLTTGASGTADQYDIYNVCAELNEYIYEIIS